MKKPKKPATPAKSTKLVPVFSRSNWFQLAIILVGVFIVYSPTLNKEFINFDDDWYIIKNPYVQHFSFSNIGKIFSEFYETQYSPLPMTFIGILNLISGNEPFLYNLSGILLHLICIFLVCWLSFRLSKNSVVAIIVAMLFGLCTLNVESVAWSSAIFKTGFYSIFFLSSLIAYTYYLSSNKSKYLAASLVFFVLSVLSKEQAVALVLSLLCIDFLHGRNLLNKKVILEKLPFLILSFIFGLISLMAAKSNIDSFAYSHYTFPQRILYASYALGEYIIKVFIPFQLSGYYPYPDPKNFSAWFYLHPLIIAGLVYLFVRVMKKNRNIAFGILFFTANILFTLVLQFVSVRGAMMADRYIYLSSIGIFYVFAEYIVILQNRKFKPISSLLISAFIILFSASSFARCGVWKNSMTFWNDMISKYQNISLAYDNRGKVFMEQKKYDQALNDYNKAIELDPNSFSPYINRGNLLTDLRRDEEALSDFNKAIKLNPRHAATYYNRGNVFMNEKKYDQAIEDYTKAISLNTNYTKAYINRGNVFQDSNRFEDAQKDFNKAIELEPDFSMAYCSRGNLFMKQNRRDEALNDFNKAIQLQPNFDKAYNSRGNLYYREKNYEESIFNYSKAIESNTGYGLAYYNRAYAEYNSGKKEAACSDLKQAVSLGYQVTDELLNQFCN